MVVALKKYKLFKVCKELNVGIDTISSFLKEKGVKVSGPNTSFSEDIYLELLESFAKEKEIADKLHERKIKEGVVKEADETKDDQEEVEIRKLEKPNYVKTIERSIEEKVEEITKKEEKVKYEPEATKDITQEDEIEATKVIEQAKRIIDEKIEKHKVDLSEKKPLEEVPAKEGKIVELVEKEVTELKEPGKEKKPKEIDDLEKEEKLKEDKFKLEEEKKRDKEDKRRKALEMIRKEDKRRKNLIKRGDIEALEYGRRYRVKKSKKRAIDQKEVQQTVKKTLASLDERLKKPKKRKREKSEIEEIVEENVIYASEFISVSDLANLMDIPVADIIKKCLELGLVVSINQRLDLDTIELLANEWGYSVIKESEDTIDILDELEEQDQTIEDNEIRAPIITIMGHVDHGKTSLLDYIRKTNVVGGESGGITQHIGAYEVNKNGKSITFLDTPGHEAFTAMRARGAQVTDIVILVVAADDDVKPQTEEAIDHARAAGVKIIVAINKIDKKEANPEKIKKQLAERNILVEDWGGEFQCAEISAKTGEGVDDLLEKVLVEADMLDLKANKNKRAIGTVIESRLDRGKGIVATILIQNGSLRIGDPFIAGQFAGKVRALLNESDKKVNDAGPSKPIQVLGFDGLPQAGDHFLVLSDERTVREISFRRQRIKREHDFRQRKLLTLDKISENIKMGGIKELKIIVKADVDGSLEALADSLLNLSTKEVTVVVIRKAVGNITESDVLLAEASSAIIIGFHVRPNAKAKELAKKEKIEIRMYKVVYDAINDVKMALEGLLGTEKSEENVCSLEVRTIFKISRLGTIAGCYVKSGKITRNTRIRLIRNDTEIYDGTISSLKRFKDDVKEVTTGFECGIQIQNYNDVKVGDIIEGYDIIEKKRTLS
jgi:translation initiation factor IF-2